MYFENGFNSGHNSMAGGSDVNTLNSHSLAHSTFFTTLLPATAPLLLRDGVTNTSGTSTDFRFEWKSQMSRWRHALRSSKVTVFALLPIRLSLSSLLLGEEEELDRGWWSAAFASFPVTWHFRTFRVLRRWLAVFAHTWYVMWGLAMVGDWIWSVIACVCCCSSDVLELGFFRLLFERRHSHWELTYVLTARNRRFLSRWRVTSSFNLRLRRLLLHDVRHWLWPWPVCWSPVLLLRDWLTRVVA